MTTIFAFVIGVAIGVGFTVAFGLIMGDGE